MINVIEMGIESNNLINQTQQLQEIINNAIPGETIYIPTGVEIVVASLRIPSDISIYLEGNSRLIASSNYKDYECWTTSENYQGEPMYAMIYAKHGANIKIYGSGTIDGNGDKFVSHKNQYIYVLDRYPRVTMMFFEDITDLIIEEITITNGCYWTIHPVGCKNVRFSGLKILQDLMMPNCDGIDPDHCQNIIISDCIIESADDCIVFKNTKYFEEYGPTKNAVISNCILKSTSAGFKIGTESFGDFANITFSNSIIQDSNRGISIQLRDGGNLENLAITNVIVNTRKFADIWWGKGEPIAITSYQRTPNESKLSKIKNIRFSNMQLDSENAIYISAQKKELISNISLSDIDFNLEKKTKWNKQYYDNRPFGAEHTGLFEEPLVGIYVNNTTVPKIRNFNFESNITDVLIKENDTQY